MQMKEQGKKLPQHTGVIRQPKKRSWFVRLFKRDKNGDVTKSKLGVGPVWVPLYVCIAAVCPCAPAQLTLGAVSPPAGTAPRCGRGPSASSWRSGGAKRAVA